MPAKEKRDSSARPDRSDPEEAAPPPRKPRPRWLIYTGVVLVGLALVIGVALAGAWYGYRSVEAPVFATPEEEDEEEILTAGLEPLALVRGLDIAQERPLPRGTSGDRLMRAAVQMTAPHLLTESAAWEPLTPDRARELERPMVPRILRDDRLDRDVSEVSKPLARAGRLGGTEPLRLPTNRGRTPGARDTVSLAPHNPSARPPDSTPAEGSVSRTGTPSNGGTVSTIAPPGVYNEAVGAPGRRHPEPFVAEYELPHIQPPTDQGPIESSDRAALGARGLAP